jgi:hypothetical protein
MDTNTSGLRDKYNEKKIKTPCIVKHVFTQLFSMDGSTFITYIK